jgi:Uma2 family endonuclease
MAPTATRLTLQEYDRLYGHESGWEYRSGVAYRKAVPTHLHALLASLLSHLLTLAGYCSGVEVDVKLTPDWSPRPDAYGLLHECTGKYPTEVDVVCEVLSDGEDILTKCQDYWATGRVRQIFVFHPEEKTIVEWNGTKLVSVGDVALANGVTITGRRIWRELEQRGKAQPPTARLLD